ncbi:MAG: alpha/beta hydrolase fold domain-containing protein [Candidatus Nanopelagicales bacterium]
MSESLRLTPTHRLVRRAFAMPPSLIERLVGPPAQIDGRTVASAVSLVLGVTRRGLASTGTGDDVQQRRRDIRRSTALMLPRLQGVRVLDRTVPGPAGAIPVRVYRSHRTVGPAPVIVYFHGGGWVVGDLETHDGSCRMLARHSGCVVVSVDYRLAPEHPFPAPLEDAVAAFSYVHSHPQEFGAVPGAVAVMGDSAGGNLAAGVCVVTRETGPAPIAQSLVYPVTDLRMGMPSIETFAEGFLLGKADMMWYREQYLTEPSQMTDPRVSPLLADSPETLPPTRVWTAGFDPLRDEGMAYAERLAGAGVDCRAVCVDDQIHGFFGMGLIPGGMEMITEVCRETGDMVHAVAR